MPKVKMTKIELKAFLKDNNATVVKEKSAARSAAGKARWAAKPEAEKEGMRRVLAAGRAYSRVSKMYAAQGAAMPYPKPDSTQIRQSAAAMPDWVLAYLGTEKGGNAGARAAKTAAGSVSNASSIPGIVGSTTPAAVKPKRTRKKKGEVVPTQAVGPSEMIHLNIRPQAGSGVRLIGEQYGNGGVGRALGSALGGVAGSLLPF